LRACSILYNHIITMSTVSHWSPVRPALLPLNSPPLDTFRRCQTIGRLQRSRRPGPRVRFSASSGRLLRWRCGRRSFSNSRLATRAFKDPDAGAKCWTRSIQAVRGTGTGKDVEGRRMARLHAWQWNELHPYCAILRGAIQQLQLLQTSAYSSLLLRRSGLSNILLQTIFEAYPNADLSSFQRLICGGIAGVTSVFFTYPLDIVRTRLSIQSASFAELGDKPKRLPGMWETMTHMYKTEGGVSALYRGIIPTVAGVAPYVRVESADLFIFLSLD
jgi:hypothetical protein